MTAETNAAALPSLPQLPQPYIKEAIPAWTGAQMQAYAREAVAAALLRAGAAKVPDLHGAIMNLPCDDSKANEEYNDRRSAYKHGHRDARHAAAELAATPPAPDAGVVEPEAEAK